MKTIYKYRLQLQNEQTIEMPEGYKIVKARVQLNQPCIWAEVDTQAKKIPKVFMIYATGEEIFESQLTFIDTVFDGEFVWHIFEKKQ